MKTPNFRDVEETAAWRRANRERKRLTCPYCGSDLIAFSTSDETVQIECTRLECGAEWSNRGFATQTPAHFQDRIDWAKF